jgi:hypothetical protein
MTTSIFIGVRRSQDNYYLSACWKGYWSLNRSTGGNRSWTDRRLIEAVIKRFKSNSNTGTLVAILFDDFGNGTSTYG